MTTISGTTESFGQGASLSRDLRAATPEQMATLAQELERKVSTAKDFVIPSAALSLRVTMGEPPEVRAAFEAPKDSPLSGTAIDLGVGRVAHEQFAEKLGIPRDYYRRCHVEAPGLLTNNVNYWLSHGTKRHLVRTLDGRIRAFLGDNYRMLDDWDVFTFVGKEALSQGGVIQRLDLSDERFYMRILRPDFGAKIEGRAKDLAVKKGFAPGYRRDNGTWQGPDSDDPNGDWVFPAIIASNSEVGRGGLNVEIAAFRVTCSNYIITGLTVHKVHLGSRLEAGLVQVQDDTRAAKDRAFWLEVRDMVRGAMDEEAWRGIVARMNEAQAEELEEPVEAVNVVARDCGLSDDDRQAVLNELISPSRGLAAGATTWGLVNAVTVLAHRKSVDEAADLERKGGELLTRLPELVKVRRK